MRRLVALVVVLFSAVSAIGVPAPVRSAPDTASTDEGPSARAEGLCDQPRVRDAQGDSTVDIVGVDISSDCDGWTIEVRLARRLADEDRSSIRLEFDLDVNPTTGCRGADRVAVFANYGQFDHHRSMYEMSGCDRRQWRAVRHPGIDVSGSTVTFRFTPSTLPATSRFRWRAQTSPGGSDRGGDSTPGRWTTALIPSGPVASLEVDMRYTVADISWTPPNRTYGSVVTGYVVSYQRVGTSRATVTSLPASARSTSISGLRAGIEYVFQVRPRTRAGVGETRSVEKRAFEVPGAPLDLTVVDDGELGHRLTWSTNPDRGGMSFIRHRVWMRTGTGPLVLLTPTRLLAEEFPLPTLTVGTRYTFRVVGDNGFAASAPTEVEYEPLPTPRRVGIDPDEFSALLRERRADPSPVSNPRSWSYRGGVCDQRPVRDRRGDGPIDIVGVFVASNCTDWEFLIETARPVPFDDDDFVFVNIDNDLDTSNGCGGADVFIAVYDVGARLEAEVYRASGCTRDTWTPLVNGFVDFPLGGLSVATTSGRLGIDGPFRWYVETHDGNDSSGADYSPDRVWRPAAMPPGKVQRLTLAKDAADPATVTVTWSPPTTDRGLRVTGYEVSYRAIGAQRWTRAPRQGLATRVQITGVARSTVYEFRVVAVNAFGPGNAATARLAVVGPPGPVRNLTIERRTDDLAIVSWKPPTNNGLRPLTRYHATVSVDGAEPVVLKPSQRLGTERYIRDFEVGRTYTVSVWADNGAYMGEPTSVSVTASRR